MGLCYATDQLLADSVALGAVIQQAFSEEFARFLLDDAIIRSSGNGQPLGIMNSNAYVSVAKESGQAADTVMWENINNMWRDCGQEPHELCMVHPPGRAAPVERDEHAHRHRRRTCVPACYRHCRIAIPTLFGRPVIEIEQADTVATRATSCC